MKESLKLMKAQQPWKSMASASQRPARRNTKDSKSGKANENEIT